jgi:hypothetical protein
MDKIYSRSIMQVLPSFNYEDIYTLFHSAKLEKQIVPKIQDATIDEKVDLTPCNGTTPKESRIREIRTYGSMRGLRS